MKQMGKDLLEEEAEVWKKGKINVSGSNPSSKDEKKKKKGEQRKIELEA